MGAQIAKDMGAIGAVSSGFLPSAVRLAAERRLHVDLRGTRLDATLPGQFRAGSLDALAVTQGSTVHFGPGQLDTTSKEGRELLGHELTHVAQQRAHGMHGAPQRQETGEDVDLEAGAVPPASQVGTEQEARKSSELEQKLAATSVAKHVEKEAPGKPAPSVEPPKKTEVVADVAKPEPATGKETPRPAAEAAGVAPAPVEENAAATPAPPEAAAAEPALFAPSPEDVTSRAVTDAVAQLTSDAASEIKEVRGVANQTRAGIRQAIDGARKAVLAKIADAKKSTADAFAGQRASAVAAKDAAEQRGAAGFQQSKASIEKEGDVKERATQLGEQHVQDARSVTATKQRETENQTSGDASTQGSGILGLVKSSMIVKIGALAGEHLLEAGTIVADKVTSLVGDVVARASEGTSTIVSGITGAFSSAMSILPDALSGFSGNLARGHDESVAQIDKLAADAADTLNRIEASAISDVTQSETQSVTAIQRAQQAGVEGAISLERDLGTEDENALEVATSALVRDAAASYASARQAFTDQAATTLANVETETRDGPVRLGAAIDKAVGTGRAKLEGFGEKFAIGVSNVVEKISALLGNVVDAAGKAFTNFLSQTADQLKGIVSNFVGWAADRVGQLGHAFIDAGTRIIAWVESKVSLGSILGVSQTKQEVVQRGFWGGVADELLDTLKGLGLLAVVAATATAILTPIFGFVGAAAIVAVGLAAVIVVALVQEAMDVLARLRKGGFSGLGLAVVFPFAFVLDFIGITSIVSAALGEDVLSGKKLSPEEQGRNATRGLMDFLLAFAGEKFFKLGAAALRETRLGRLAAREAPKVGELLGRVGERVSEFGKGLLESGKRVARELVETGKKAGREIGEKFKGVFERGKKSATPPTPPAPMAPAPKAAPLDNLGALAERHKLTDEVVKILRERAIDLDAADRLLTQGMTPTELGLYADTYGAKGILMLDSLVRAGATPRVATRTIDLAHDVGAGPQVIDLVNSGKLENVRGLRGFLQQIAAELKQGKTGKFDELMEASRRAANGKRVSIGGRPMAAGEPESGQADILDFDDKEALQLKTVTSADSRAVINNLQRGINQVGGRLGEVPPTGFKRIVSATVLVRDNPISRMTRGELLDALRGAFHNLDDLKPPGAPLGEVRITNTRGTFSFTPDELK